MNSEWRIKVDRGGGEQLFFSPTYVGEGDMSLRTGDNTIIIELQI